MDLVWCKFLFPGLHKDSNPSYLQNRYEKQLRSVKHVLNLRNLPFQIRLQRTKTNEDEAAVFSHL